MEHEKTKKDAPVTKEEPEEIRRLREKEDAADDLAFQRAIARKKGTTPVSAKTEGGTVFLSRDTKPGHPTSPEDSVMPVSPDTAEDGDATRLFPHVKAETIEAENAEGDGTEDPILGPILAKKTAEHVTDEKRGRDRIPKWLLIPAICLLVLITGYLTFVFAPIPFVRGLRNIYIETAMTTGDHQWLATAFIPGYIIDDVMAGQVNPDIIGGLDHLSTKDETTTEVSPGTDTATLETTHPVTEEPLPPEEPDILGLKTLKEGEKDYAGYTVKTVDEEEGLFISEIVGKTDYDGLDWTIRGLVMLIDDPSRVFMGTTPEKKVRGYRIGEMMEYYGDVIAGVNASGFHDPNDSGDGKDLTGYCMSEGEGWGYYAWGWDSIVLTEDHKLVVGNIGNNWKKYNIRDGMQFGPALIADGEVLVTGSAGRGIHPRTAVGQREDGAIILLVLDGRDPTYTAGCTVGDMARIMKEYGAVNAGCCDGGSSCVLAYEGVVLNRNSSANPKYGRRMPNAFLVRSKKAVEAPAD